MLSLLSSTALAGRSIRTPTQWLFLETLDPTCRSAVVNANGWMSCTNFSSLPQNLVVTLIGEAMTFSYRKEGSGAMWGGRVSFPQPNRRLNFALAPSSTASTSWIMSCGFGNSGPDSPCNGTGYAPTPSSIVANYVSNLYEVSLQADVAEDRGAVSCSLTLKSHISGGGANQIVNFVSHDLNGGRAF